MIPDLNQMQLHNYTFIHSKLLKCCTFNDFAKKIIRQRIKNNSHCTMALLGQFTFEMAITNQCFPLVVTMAPKFIH